MVSRLTRADLILLNAAIVKDNRALSQAAARAKAEGVHLIALFVLSPQDYEAHDRSARRIDFTLRNLKNIQVRSLPN